MGSQILTAIVTGLLLLLLEYKTGWFAKHTPLPDLRSIIGQLIKKSLESIQRLSSIMSKLLRVAIPLLIILINIFFLSPESQTYSGITTTLFFLLILLGIPAVLINKPPMNLISALIIIGNVVVILTLLNNSENLIPSWPPKFIFSKPDMTDVKTISMFTILVVFSAIWITAYILVANTKTEQEKSREQLELLYEASEISTMIQDVESRLVNSVRIRWEEFRDHLKTINPRAADAIYHYLPIEFEGYTLHIGCLTNKEVFDVIEPFHTANDTQLPPLKGIIESTLREFFGRPRIKILCKKIESDKYTEIKNLMDNELKK